MAVVCPRCGEENPDRARFCMTCSEPLAGGAAEREERKVVSVLFADLVGHTAASERADPEDVRARLSAYHARLKHEIERFGGTVEKFVGDAVMAVFGAPAAHEDDAERAVRAGLAILGAMEELGLPVRVAVNTGEAVVALGARPELGEGMVTGDVVNTASRLQGSAPAGGLVVGEQTYWSTHHMIDYEPLKAVSVKGKAEPVLLWLARGARSRFGIDIEPGRAAPLVGRRDELAVLQQAYGRTLRESACHLVTLVGEPGIGKSRLVAELRDFVDAQEELVFWRQGRCLPYGEGIAFWALGEIVKAHAGILESDEPGVAREKLARTVEPLIPTSAEQSWIAGELARLVGAAQDGTGAAARDESFAAWRAFLEAIAAQRPLVLVLEDLHWADAALLEFLEHLTDWVAGVPLLVLCSARPELYELNPAWSGGKRNATTLSLSPLSAEETAQLLAALLERSVLPAETQQELLERAGGNPLYAEQFVRMMREREADGDVQIPETVQALIAARLDTLGPERKALLQDAAVVGKVFWAGAVADIGDAEESAVRDGLHDLVRRDLIRPSRVSSVEQQAEFAFGHGLVRDVVYAQIPRAERVRKHEAAGRWIERLAGDRVADHAELLAHHYREALALARAAGLPADELEEGARRFLLLAAERAVGIDLPRGASLFEEALELAPPGHPDRGRMLSTFVETGGADPKPPEEVDALLDEAFAELRAAGDEVGLGKVMVLVSHQQWVRGEAPEATRLLDEAVELLERHEPGPELAHAYSLSAGRAAIRGEPHAALDWTGKAIPLAESLGLERFVLRNQQFRGIARCSLGDLGGVDDLRESLRRSLELGFTREAELGYNNLGSWLWLSAGAEEALRVYRDSVAFNERRGVWLRATWSRGEMTWPLFDAGQWDELLETARALEDLAAGRSGSQPELMALGSKGRVLYYRGRAEEAAAIAADLLPRARAVGDPQVILPVLSLAALVEAEADAALALIEEMLSVDAPENPLYPDSARVCLRHGAPELAERMIRTDERAAPRTRHVGVTVEALLADYRGNLDEAAALYREAVQRWTDYPFVLERALCLLALARVTGEQEPAAEGLELLRGLGAEGLAEAAAA
jgi:class 3 adenylate cyclase/tetratricopeptide (TPR) repeat protein